MSSFGALKKISSLNLREDIHIIYSTFLFYLTFNWFNRILKLLLPQPLVQ
ncbi:hypothetical protein J2Y45_006290 [Dyadobacter sp. BE34]|uniref:Uncharacterized protein n=1 Tax=Dyadobacter fermentans TaxID=94254 RepID=A0ABU1R6P5_9BACT|nr:hypothetical protein [Dyadobacter fermentans]MDR7046819.1 hypothetical protein [Dyadobacter sp. BE242]MDR7201133.1 hypothetical protein [Dyadobacter sp. BE34]MDR7219093.1 hypothetical protein [Dyadobacter sp. BE31]MDR7264697.1 hypothetical protein [Dyadobacter sp. BE32]